MKGNYACISTFGQNLCTVDDPLSYCLTQSMDNYFNHSPTGVTYGPYSSPCQAYMAERCSKNWDAFCEYYYQKHATQQYPNTAQNCNRSNQLLTFGITVGESLLGNAASRRFCQFPDCKVKKEPFDPNVANSPWITYYEGCNCSGGACHPICSVDPAAINTDLVMNKCLDNPMACYDTLVNICNTSRRNGTDLSGTRIGEFCQNYFNGSIRPPRTTTMLSGRY